MNSEEIAKKLHDNYESLSKVAGWKTQESCQVEFENLPKRNKEVMIAQGLLVKQMIEGYYKEQLAAKIEEIEKSKTVLKGCCAVSFNNGLESAIESLKE